MERLIFAWLPKKLVIDTPFGIMPIGWAWLRKVKIRKNIYLGWVSFVNKDELIKDFIKNASERYPVPKSRGVYVNTILGMGKLEKIEGNKYMVYLFDKKEIIGFQKEEIFAKQW